MSTFPGNYFVTYLRLIFRETFDNATNRGWFNIKFGVEQNSTIRDSENSVMNLHEDSIPFIAFRLHTDRDRCFCRERR
jgi:hypothetical protein